MVPRTSRQILRGSGRYGYYSARLVSDCFVWTQSRGCGQTHAPQQGLLGQDKHPNSDGALSLQEVRCAIASSANKLEVCTQGKHIMIETPEPIKGNTDVSQSIVTLHYIIVESAYSICLQTPKIMMT